MPNNEKHETVHDLLSLKDLDAKEISREGAEDEDDLSRIRAAQFRETLIAATDWTTETILRQLDRKNININPEFQRRDAWTQERKSTFIESVILGLPIPQLVLAESKTKKGAYIVLDGKQRLLALRQFVSDGSDGYSRLILKGLEQRPELNGLSLADMKADPNFASDVSAFENETIRTVVVKNWPNESALYLIFLRLNTGSVALSPQELRQALHPGPFVSFVDETSSTIEGLRFILNTRRADFRMRDAELLVRYYAFQYFFENYHGNMKSFLDETCEKLNEEWERSQAEIREKIGSLERAFDATIEIFGRDAFCKWDGSSYERRPNRAIVDIMTYYFSDPSIAEGARANSAAIRSRFNALCEEPDFRRALETTTKSIDATVHRFSIWGSHLHKILDVSLRIPTTVNRRIVLQSL